MSIENKLTRLVTARDNIRIALNDKGIDASEHGFEDFAEDIGDIEEGENLSDVDIIVFGDNPTLPDEGKTNPANYEAIADAINAARARPNAVTLESLNVTENGTYTAPSGKAYPSVIVDVQNQGPTIPEGIEVGTFTVASNANTVTVNHSFGHVPKIAVCIAAMPGDYGDGLFYEVLGRSPANGDFSYDYAVGQKIDQLARIEKRESGNQYQGTTTYTTYPAAMTTNSVTFATGRYYNIQFVPGQTYFYVIGG